MNGETPNTIQHTIKDDNGTHVFTHGQSWSIACKYCKALIKSGDINQAVIEKEIEGRVNG